MGDSGSGAAEASDARRSRLRTAMRTNRWIVAVLVAAVALPLFIHYSGFRPARDLMGLGYPVIHKYPFRSPPGFEPHQGLDFSQIWLSARRMSSGKQVYYPVDQKKWRREWSSTYHPLTHWLYRPIGKLPFPTALVLHNLAGIGLLLLVQIGSSSCVFLGSDK